MRIEDHLLADVPYMPSPNRSGRITPRLIVDHYTAGFSAEGAISWLRTRGSQASAHVVVDAEGEVTQLVPFNVKAWHAGPSKYGRFRSLNSHSIGIEIVNVGWLRKQADGTFRDWMFYDRNLRDKAAVYREGEGDLAGRDLIEQPHSRVGGGMLYWPTYTEAQLDVLDRIHVALIDAYPIEDVVSHEEIDTRGWKTDPGPAFPMQRYKRLLGNDRSDEPDENDVDMRASLQEIRDVIDAELARDPPSERHLRWRHAEIIKRATEALAGE